ncbi:hypothetical protein ACFV84_00750 [Kitasatospora sp. NPDC059811]|uniref:hypothetical protein n=1 Tax=Streptomycetaceae TaxID=2062 RepID=UPI0007AFE0A9|nr:hypothetical protein [Streptomyces sp. MJM8645]
MFSFSVHRRVRRAAAVTVAAAAAGAAMLSLAAAPAYAATPSYACDDVTTVGPLGEGVLNCVPSGGAPSSGTISTTFTIVRRSDQVTLTCVPVAGVAGEAVSSDLVTGLSCTE